MKRFKNILFFADGAMHPGPALERAVTLADSNNARLTVIDVIDEHDSSPQIQSRIGSDLNEILREHRRQALEELVKPFNGSDTVIYIQVLSGTPFIEVTRSVISSRYDLVIKAARPPDGITERLFGSSDMHLMRKCPCPVWIDRPAAAFPYRRILAAVNPVGDTCGECDRLVMDLASSLALGESAELVVVHAWRVHGESILRSGRGRIPATELDQHIERTWLLHQEGLDKLLADYDLSTRDPRVHLLKGNPASRIQSLTKELKADLVVLGTVGRTGIPGFIIGNTAEEVLQTTTASVLAVKPAGFISPVTTSEIG
ncbi:universal stress protein [Pseudomonadota bacterium]